MKLCVKICFLSGFHSAAPLHEMYQSAAETEGINTITKVSVLKDISGYLFHFICF